MPTKKRAASRKFTKMKKLDKGSVVRKSEYKRVVKKKKK